MCNSICRDCQDSWWQETVKLLQDEWLAELNAIMQSIPLDSDDDPAREEARRLGVNKLRVFVALRWEHVFHLKTLLPSSEWTRLSEEVSSCIRSVMDLHGDEFPWAPDMPDILVKEPENVIPLQTGDSETAKPERGSSRRLSSSSTSSASSKQCLPHSFKWIEMREGVWTVLEAGSNRAFHSRGDVAMCDRWVPLFLCVR